MNDTKDKIRAIAEKYNFNNIDYAVHVWSRVNQVLTEQGTWCPFHEQHGACEICGGVEEFIDFEDDWDGNTVIVPVYGFTLKYLEEDQENDSVFHIS